MNYSRAIDALDTANYTVANLLTALFEPIKNNVDVAERRSVALIKRACLDRLESQLRRASLEANLQMEQVLLETAQIDPLSPPWEKLPTIDPATREAYEAMVASLEEPDSIRHDIALVHKVWRSRPRIFAKRDDFLSEFYAARLEADSSALAEESVDEEPDLDVEDAQGLLAADGGLQAKRLKTGERMIRQTSNIFFDLVKQHADPSQHALIDDVQEAFAETCIRRFRRALDRDRDGRELLYQLLTVNPLRLKISSMRGIDAEVEDVWDRNVGYLADDNKYKADLERLRGVIADRPSLFNGAPESPRTVDALRKSIAVRDDEENRAQTFEPREKVLHVQRAGHVMIVKLLRSNYIQQRDLKYVEQELTALAESTPSPRIVIDFTDVVHVSSLFVGVLFTANKLIKLHKGRLALCELSDSLRQMLELTGAHRIIQIYTRLDVAVERLRD